MKIYLAGPFFNQEQNDLYDEVIAELKAFDHKVYIPRDEQIYDPETGMEGAEALVQDNIDSIKSCDAVIAIMNGKDMGTMMEIGMAVALNKQVGLLWNNPPDGAKFNIMLTATAEFTCTNLDELSELAETAAADGQLPFTRYAFEGDME